MLLHGGYGALERLHVKQQNLDFEMVSLHFIWNGEDYIP